MVSLRVAYSWQNVKIPEVTNCPSMEQVDTRWPSGLTTSIRGHDPLKEWHVFTSWYVTWCVRPVHWPCDMVCQTSALTITQHTDHCTTSVLPRDVCQYHISIHYIGTDGPCYLLLHCIDNMFSIRMSRFVSSTSHRDVFSVSICWSILSASASHRYVQHLDEMIRLLCITYICVQCMDLLIHFIC